MLDAENGIVPEVNDLVVLTADIVSTYVTNNNVAADELTGLIRDVHEALEKAASAQASPQPPPLVPAVPVRSSVTPEYIFCLEDGQPFKFLTRHLKTKYNLTPQEYRRKWNLPATYPMVAPNYSVKRAEMAKESKLGHRRA
jgi:predicted transcriptional regulator